MFQFKFDLLVKQDKFGREFFVGSIQSPVPVEIDLVEWTLVVFPQYEYKDLERSAMVRLRTTVEDHPAQTPSIKLFSKKDANGDEYYIGSLAEFPQKVDLSKITFFIWPPDDEGTDEESKAESDYGEPTESDSRFFERPGVEGAPKVGPERVPVVLRPKVRREERQERPQPIVERR